MKGTSFKNAQVFYQVEGEAEIEITDCSNTVEPSGFERQTGVDYTLDSDLPVMTEGKIGEGEIKLKMLYQHGSTGKTKALHALHEAGDSVRLIWYPKGKVDGNDMYATEYGFLKSMISGGGEASSANPMLAEATLATPYYRPSTYTAG